MGRLRQYGTIDYMEQHVTLQIHAGKRYIVSRSLNQFIRTPQDMLDLLAWGYENATTLFLLMDTDFISEFYDLKTGLAGEILQKISNYGARLAIVGTFESIESRRFKELMVESNKGAQVRFTHNRNEAISWLLQ